MPDEQRKTLTGKERENLPESAFALPGRRYPIHDLAHARNALARVAQNGTPEEQAAVKTAVYKRYPELKSSERAFQPDEPDADDMGGPDDGDHDQCETCGGTGETDMGECPDCGGSGLPKVEGLVGGQSFNSELLRGSLEFRRFAAEGMELRDTTDGGLRFGGYASVTETPYPVGRFEETFARGAFKRCLGEDPDVVFQVNHGEGGQLPLARTKSGTMTLTEDARGLRVDADLDPKDPDVQALIPKLRRGDVSEMSFAFRATDDEWSEDKTKRLVRSATIHRGDVSIVTHGANSATSGGIRSLVEEFEQRGGRKNSKADRAEIEDSIKKLQALIAPEEDAEQSQAEDAKHAELKVTVMRGQLEVAKARRRRYA